MGALTLPDGVETNKDFATALSGVLTADLTMEFEVLIDDGDDDDYTICLYNDDGYVKIFATATSYSINALQITAGLFDSTMPLVANLISASMGVHLEEDATDPGWRISDRFRCRFQWRLFHE